MDASEKWMIFQFHPTPKWMFFQELVVKSSLLLNGYAAFKNVRQTAVTTFAFSSAILWSQRKISDNQNHEEICW